MNLIIILYKKKLPYILNITTILIVSKSVIVSTSMKITNSIERLVLAMLTI